MKHNFSKQEIIEFGKRLAKAGIICEYKPQSHSHNCFSLFPQTEEQYNWLKRKRFTRIDLTL